MTLYKSLIVVSFLCIILFLCLAFIAIGNYPGGSAHDPSASGFNIIHNYWCDLYKSTGHNGSPNNFQWASKLASIIISVSMAIFWIIASIYFIKDSTQRLACIICGFIAFISASLIFTSLHDIMIIIGSLTGGIAFTILLYWIFKSGERFLFYWGLICIFFIVFCNSVYFFNFISQILSWLQKISFMVVILWAISIMGYIYSKDQILDD